MIFAVLLLLVPMTSYAELQKIDTRKSEIHDETHDLEVKCKQGSDERHLTIVPSEQGCTLHYLKNSESSVVVTSKTSFTICESVQKQIRSSLESAHYQCN
jgi:hypothetical protein